MTLPIEKRLREATSDLVKLTGDKDTAQELTECNRRLAELREEVAMFLSQSAEEYVYWVERAGKTQKNLALNAAPIDVADFLRRRLFGGETSIVMTSATLSISERSASDQNPKTKTQAPGGKTQSLPVSPAGGRALNSGLGYFVRRVGAEAATALQVGTPFDYERQMKLFVVLQTGTRPARRGLP